VDDHKAVEESARSLSPSLPLWPLPFPLCVTVPITFWVLFFILMCGPRYFL
jgi:hypothetical protein